MGLQTMTEEWRPVLGYEGFYEVSSLGRVRSLDREIVRRDGRPMRFTGRVLLPRKIKGYLAVTLFKMGVGANCYVHTLVCSAWHGARPSGMQVCHGDGSRINNVPGNLRWGSAKDNQGDRIIHGTSHLRGVRKLTEDAVAAIRSEYKKGARGPKQRELAAKYGTSIATISMVSRGVTWDHLK